MGLKDKRIIFIGFALALFALSAKAANLLLSGIGQFNDSIGDLLLVFSLLISSVYLGYKLLSVSGDN